MICRIPQMQTLKSIKQEKDINIAYYRNKHIYRSNSALFPICTKKHSRHPFHIHVHEKYLQVWNTAPGLKKKKYNFISLGSSCVWKRSNQWFITHERFCSWSPTSKFSSDMKNNLLLFSNWLINQALNDDMEMTIM